MKSRIAIITIIAMAFFGVMAFADDPGDNPGQIIDNPWANLFTTAAPTEAPTEAPTVEPTTEAPTEAPTVEPTTEEPTVEPTTEAPTEAPTVEPTTEAPTEEPTTEKPAYPYDEWVNTDRNLALAGTASDTGVHREGAVSQLNDGVIFDWENRDGITTDNTPGSFDIKLDKAYDAASIDQVAVYWRCSEANFYPSSYQIQFGYKGTFTTVAAVTSADTSGEIVPGWVNDGRFVTEKDFTTDRVESSPVDTVRILVSVPVGYGCQAREVAVFAEDPQDAPQQPQAAAPDSISAESSDYGEISFTITPGPDQDGYKYNVYAGEKLIGEGLSGNVPYVAYDFEPGTYTLSAVSIVHGMDPSDPVYSDPVTVADPMELFASDKNKAPGGAITYVSSFYNDSYDLDTSQCAIDGTPVAGEANNQCLRTGANKQPATIDIDLGRQYQKKDFEGIVLAYTNPRTYAADTVVGISDDGETYYSVGDKRGHKVTKDGQLSANLIPADIDDDEGTFRYVRINLQNGVNGWGYVVNQIGVIIDAEPEPTTEAPTQESTEAPTGETETGQPTTEAPTAEPTTEAPTVGPLVPDTNVITDAWTKAGDYSVYTGSWGAGVAKYGEDPSDSSHIAVVQTNSNWSEPWITQVMLQIPSISERVAAGEEFTAEWPVQSANNDGKVKASGNDAEQFLTGEKQTITGKVELKDDVASFVIGMGWVGLGNTVQFYQPTIKDKDGNIVYPPAEPTTVEPTTQAPTQEPTTVAPTVKPSVMPTAVPVVKVPEKTLIKKIYKKKKSAKKIKIKIKKIKDAKGYQVAIYKSKKKAKKNKKALVKKYVKYKKKITIKSKKLKKKKKLYVRARAYTLDGVKKVFGPWSKVKKAKIKK